MWILNPPNTGAITSNTLNLTRITTMIAVALGITTTVSGAGARAADSGTEIVDWAGFNHDQRLVLIVALIAAVAVVHAVDLLARSLASVTAGSTGVIPLPTPLPAVLIADGPDVPGYAIAIRPDGHVLFRDEENQDFIWSGQVNIAP
jgi:hypothetical protein